MSDQNFIVSQIKNRIKEAREKKELTQSGVAKYLGISRTAITQWEGGLTFPSYDKTMEMARLFGVRPEWIAFGVTTPVEYRVPTDATKVEMIQFGETPDDRSVVGTHYLDNSFIRETLRASSNAGDLFVYVLESESFRPRFVPYDHLIVDSSVSKVTEGHYLIWTGLSAQVVNVVANYAEPGTVIVKSTESGDSGNVVEVSKLHILGRIKGRISASHS
ncbi:MAG: helix-turn-helix transcriptional regulator [Hoeflea sp.]|uniref:helix-turn-helix transcriptional regulator n=1 Tax=Hoeflea sp. TaxID=1940281 RepID=UPI0032ECA5E9